VWVKTTQKVICINFHVELCQQGAKLQTAKKKKAVIQYHTRCYFNVSSKADRLNLPHETKNKKKRKKEKLKCKNGYAQKYQQTVWGIHGVSPDYALIY